MSFPEPRAFQDDAHGKLRLGAKEHRCQIICAPTGAGKTYLGLRIINEALKRGKRAIFICDRITLIDQTSQVAFKYGLEEMGIIQGNHPMFDLSYPFQIASAQTLASRGWGDDEYDVIVIDECHTIYKSWAEYIPDCSAKVIGLSATPFSKGLGKLFSNLVNAATMHDLVESKVLVRMEVFSCTQINMKGIKTNGGEWSDKAVEERGTEIIGNVVAEWIKYGDNQKTIVFGATIKHCEDMCRQFNNSSVNAAVYSSETPDDERKVLLDEYRKPDSKLRVLISVEALAKGFDVPDVGCVCDVRPLRKSLSTFIQLIGRGLRSHSGKEKCILLDFSGNIVRFREDFEDIYFNGLDSLDMGTKLDNTVRKDDDEREAQGCPKCGEQPFFKRCMHCGYEKVSICTIEHLPGEMVAMQVCKKFKAVDNRDLYNQIATTIKAGKTKLEKQSGYAAIMYKQIVGEYPRFDFHTAPMVQPSREIIGKIKSARIAFAKRKRA